MQMRRGMNGLLLEAGKGSFVFGLLGMVSCESEPPILLSAPWLAIHYL